MASETLMIKIVIVAVVATLCASQDLGDYGYIACDNCQVPDDEFPEEGKMVCFEVKNETKSYKRSYQECQQITCDGSDIFCVPGEVCTRKTGEFLVEHCKLERKTAYESIQQITPGEYHVYPQRYYEDANYPNNTYCVWNIANSGYISFHIMEQQLQAPANASICAGPGCDCPDSVKITMGTNGLKLCGSTPPSTRYHVSSNGLHIRFCSDNKHTAKGFFIRAHKTSNDTVEKKREVKQRLQSKIPPRDSTEESDNATCQYSYMMRLSQPDVPCPDKLTIQFMLQYHNLFMSASRQNEEMCSIRRRYPTSVNTKMPMMNKIEMCAVEYLYHTLDHEFAQIAVNSVNKELSGVAHAVINNELVKRSKRMNRRRAK